jgi:hypothetical protein
LPHYADIIFQGKYLAQAGAENRLRVSHDYADELTVDFLRLLDVDLHAGGTCHSVPLPFNSLH